VCVCVCVCVCVYVCMYVCVCVCVRVVSLMASCEIGRWPRVRDRDSQRKTGRWPRERDRYSRLYLRCHQSQSPI